MDQAIEKIKSIQKEARLKTATVCVMPKMASIDRTHTKRMDQSRRINGAAELKEPSEHTKYRFL